MIVKLLNGELLSIDYINDDCLKETLHKIYPEMYLECLVIEKIYDDLICVWCDTIENAISIKLTFDSYVHIYDHDLKRDKCHNVNVAWISKYMNSIRYFSVVYHPSKGITARNFMYTEDYDYEAYNCPLDKTTKWFPTFSELMREMGNIDKLPSFYTNTEFLDKVEKAFQEYK
jgi:hypothetical protein